MGTCESMVNRNIPQNESHQLFFTSPGKTSTISFFWNLHRMRIKNSIILILTTQILLSLFGCREEVQFANLVERNGFWYHKLDEKPFSGTVCCQTRGQVINGKREGRWTIWFESGHLSAEAFYKNGDLDGPYESYYDNGRLSLKGYYKNGIMVGRWAMYNEDGTLEGMPDFDSLSEDKN